MRPAKETASAALLAAALSGLLAGCDSSSSATTAPTEDTPTSVGAKVLSVKVDSNVTTSSFTSECDARGGLVQTHAVCSGNNKCQGYSYNKWSFEWTEHTCKGLNTCGGLSCVVLPKSKGQSGTDIYNQKCAGCHGKEVFAVYVAPGTDTSNTLAKFLAKPLATHVQQTAFGIQGTNASGTSYTNMPAYHEDYSRSEIEATGRYLRSLPRKVEVYGIVGESENLGKSSGSM
jgi:cytochrome c5